MITEDGEFPNWFLSESTQPAPQALHPRTHTTCDVKKTHVVQISFTLISLTGSFYARRWLSVLFFGVLKSKEKRSFYLTLGKGSEVAVRIADDQ